MSFKIVLLDATEPAAADRLRTLLPEGFVLDHGTRRGDEHLKRIIADADFAITGQVGVNGDVLRAARRLKLLHKWGVGTDNLDLKTAAELGIQIARTTGSNALPVAEFTIGLMISALRFQALGNQQLQRGHWMAFNELPAPAFCLSGQTVGIVGFGAIGQQLARLLSSFGCELIYTQRTRLSQEVEAELGASYVTLSRLLSSADIVSLHCPLTPQTANLIDAQALATMKSSAVLINVARGGVVAEVDLAQALRNRTIRVAAMDVYSVEPLPADSELLGLDNLVLTPHLAAATDDTFEPGVQRMFRNMQLVAEGQPIPEYDRVV